MNSGVKREPHLKLKYILPSQTVKVAAQSLHIELSASRDLGIFLCPIRRSSRGVAKTGEKACCLSFCARCLGLTTAAGPADPP